MEYKIGSGEVFILADRKISWWLYVYASETSELGRKPALL